MELYHKAALYVSKPEFRRWLDNPAEPRDWTGAADFLGLNGADKFVDPVERLEEVRAAIQAAFDWCKANDTIYLTHSDNPGITIHLSDLANLLDFLASLAYRFPEYLERRGRDKAGDEGEKPFWDWG